VPANPWELRADVRPLEAAAQRWTEIGALMARRGDEIVEAARRATEGWDAAAAESYDAHRRQVLANLDRFTTLADQVAGSLRAISGILTSSQKELDHAWTTVALVPHEVVGESRHLVFKPSEDEDRGKVERGQQQVEEIRGRLTLSLDQESTRLRNARAELVMVRTELTTLMGGGFPGLLAPGEEASGVGMVAPASTSVPGSAQGGVSALPPIAPISVSMPDLTGISAAGLAAFAAAAAGGTLGRRGGAKPPAAGVPPIGGMGAGAVGARAGTMSRGMASGRTGPARLATPRLAGAEDEATRIAREKEAAREAKRAALEQKRAERAARRAEREAAREAARERRGAGRLTGEDEADDEAYDEAGPEDEGAGGDAAPDEADGRPAVITVVHHAPDGEHGEPRR
jgi:hypothetical protein